MSDLNEPTFQDELEALINKHSLERHSNTPDFILAEYMASCLHNFNRAVFARTKWYAPVNEAVEHGVHPTLPSGGEIPADVDQSESNKPAVSG